MRVAVTGAGGFLGWHLRVLADARGGIELVSLGRDECADDEALALAIDGCERVIHLAGVNRGSDAEVREGNVRPAEVLARALPRCDVPPFIVYASSAQVGNGSVYAEGKSTAGDLLRQAASRCGSRMAEVRLPNIFGEHGRPFYNSVVATFSHLLATGGHPELHEDRDLELLHVGEAVALLLDTQEDGPVTPIGSVRTVGALLSRLTSFADTYSRGEIPALVDRFSVDLFNTYRSFCAPAHDAVALPRHEDHRGALVEAVKVHGGTGQTFFSTSCAGVTRGQHYHLRKVERFVVVEGAADIRLRKKFADDVVTYRVTGEHPVAVDMPTMWVHSITNTGSEPLLTLFWANDIFDPGSPDTYPEEV